MWVTRSMARLGSKLGWLGLCVAVGQAIGGGLARADSKPEKADAVAQGYEIFNREWMPNDPRGHGGDGLGPVYNDSSCVACHNSGGSGGAGPVSKNIDILSASRNLAVQQAPGSTTVISSPTAAIDPLLEVHAGFRTSRTVVLHKFGTDPNYDSWRSQALRPSGPPASGALGTVTLMNAPPNSAGIVLSEPPGTFVPAPPELKMTDVAQAVVNGRRADEVELRQRLLAKVDELTLADLRVANSKGDGRAGARIAEIRSSLLASNPSLRQGVLPVGQFTVARSQRNPTALFGLGLIDAIPDAAIEAVAKREAKKTPATQGRVSRLKDGRIGRLGWKAQTTNVEEFVLNACAVELGLEVPGHHQAISPQAPKYRTTGLDLTSGECAALVAYVRSLPKPVERRPSSTAEAKHLGAGKAMFASVGCADCHTATVGDVEGIYSDLLLHDMGPEMADEGSYSDDGDDGDDPLGPLLSPGVGGNRPAKSPAQQSRKGATKQEWRTPPLWGCRDSGPYLHDGRAQTLEQAVALHGGQGATSARKFFELSPRERLQVEAFLKSLVAPPSTHLAQRGD